MSSPGFTVSAFQVAKLPVAGWNAYFGSGDATLHELAFYIWHLERDGLHVLVDAGLPAAGAERDDLIRASASRDARSLFTDIRVIDDAMAAFGLQPDDIDIVLITQTITYHTGGLIREWFPRAEVYLSLAGVQEFLTSPVGHPATDLYFTRETWNYIRDLAISGRLHVTDGPVQVRAGLTFETTGGHHPGSAAVKVDTGSEVLGILETAFLQKNIDDLHPIGIAEDVAQCRRMIVKYHTECDRVVAIHEPANMSLFPIR